MKSKPAIKRPAKTTASEVRKRDAQKPQVKSRAGADTRLKLLDAAERLFAENGYDGTSLRDIATRAKLHLALSTYHFGTKERLFEEVIQRRAVEMQELRLAELEKIDLNRLPRQDSVRALIEAYAMPMIRARYSSSRQWQAHVRLLSQLISVKRWVPLIRKNYDISALRFIEELGQLLPEVDHDRLLDYFSFMVSAMFHVCSYASGLNKQKARQMPAKEDIDAAVDNFFRFTHAGFLAL